MNSSTQLTKAKSTTAIRIKMQQRIYFSRQTISDQSHMALTNTVFQVCSDTSQCVSMQIQTGPE